MQMYEYKPLTLAHRWMRERESDRRLSDVMGRDVTARVIIGLVVLVVLVVAAFSGAMADAAPRAMVLTVHPDGCLNVRTGAGLEYPAYMTLAWHDVVAVDWQVGEWSLVKKVRL